MYQHFAVDRESALERAHLKGGGVKRLEGLMNIQHSVGI